MTIDDSWTSKTFAWNSRWSSLRDPVLDRLRSRKLEFTSRRTKGCVDIQVNGKDVGQILVQEGSIGLNFQAWVRSPSHKLPTVIAKPHQCERKKVVVICAFLATIVDDRPSEERRPNRPSLGFGGPLDPKKWYSKFDRDKHVGEHEAFLLQRDFSNAWRSLINVFNDVGAAMRSATRSDVREAVERVQKDLPFLIGELTEEEWMDLYRSTLVKEVHDH